MMKQTALAALLACASLSAFAGVTVTEPWVVATVPSMKTTGAYMQLQSDVDARLVEARSSAARVVEIHEMAMHGNVMKMNAIPALDLPAGKPVMLTSGGNHIMLIDLVAQVKEGAEIPLTLVIEGRDGKRETIEVVAPVRPLNRASAHAPMQHKH